MSRHVRVFSFRGEFLVDISFNERNAPSSSSSSSFIAPSQSIQNNKTNEIKDANGASQKLTAYTSACPIVGYA